MDDDDDEPYSPVSLSISGMDGDECIRVVVVVNEEEEEGVGLLIIDEAKGNGYNDDDDDEDDETTIPPDDTELFKYGFDAGFKLLFIMELEAKGALVIVPWLLSLSKRIISCRIRSSSLIIAKRRNCCSCSKRCKRNSRTRAYNMHTQR